MASPPPWSRPTPLSVTAKGPCGACTTRYEPYAEAKLVRCIRGAAFDAIIDLRPGSKSYCKWFGVELTADNGRMLYVPEGFAHGYLTLSDHTEIFYQVSQFYAPDAEKGVRWNDPSFGIAWPITDKLIISPKDKVWPLFNG